MTMILTCLTKDFIVQASDRRLVYRRGRKIIYKEDDRNKALFYDNHTVFAYTGLATLSNQKFAIDWAAELLAQPTNLRDAMVYLCESATRLLETHPFSGYSDDQRRLGFVGAGFINWVEAGKTVRRPAYFIISNFMNHEGEPQPPPYNKFRAYFNYPLPYGKPAFKLFRAGQPLEKDGEKEIRSLRRCFQKRQGRVRPETIGRLLTRAIQRTAAINKMVGKNIICTFVPREYREDTGNNREIHAGGIILNRPAVSEGLQQVAPPGHLTEQERFIMPPLGDLPRCLYIPGDSSSLPLYQAIHVFPGDVVPELCTTDIALTLPPVRSTGGGEMEITAGDWSASLSAKLVEGKWV